MSRVPPPRRRRGARALKPWLATLLVLPALVSNGIIIFEVIVNAKRYGTGELMVAWISVIGVLWALAFLSVVVRDWPRWWALLLCMGLVLIDLASIGWWVYLFAFTVQ
jgi:hypothetical protein